MSHFRGFPIVLTADRLLMAEYATLFDAMVAASQTTRTPRMILERLLMPSPRSDTIKAKFAPFGLRRIEAALLDAGLEPVVVHPDRLHEAIGPDTRIVGISTGEPLGLGMNSNTMVGITGGRIWPQVFFEETLEKALKLTTTAHILIGGPGAWQFAHTEERPKSRVHIQTGYSEGNVASMFQALLDGQALPVKLVGEQPSTIPAITGAALFGAVEISRGCCMGCTFCTIAEVPMRHLPIETILSDVKMNLKEGNGSIALLSEDFLRYGAKGLIVDPNKTIEMLEQVRRVDGVKLMQVDHLNISSVAQYDDNQLKAVHDVLTRGQKHDYLWVNLGVETASGRLLAENGGKAKMAGCPPDEWGKHTAEQVRRLLKAGFYPLISVVLGLPGETPEDAQATLNWIRQFKDDRLSVFPLFFAPLSKTDHPEPTKTHWQIMRESYNLNFKWVPHLVFDNDAGAGVPLSRRLFAQCIGKGQVVWWNTAFALHQKKANP
jgi:radical SAM superfamily enzyme YgiQ (UPF0313 family)